MENLNDLDNWFNTKSNESLIRYMGIIPRTSWSPPTKEHFISKLKAILDGRIKGSLVPLNGATLISTLGLFSMHPIRRTLNGQKRTVFPGQ
jgi:hypothetical protein